VPAFHATKLALACAVVLAAAPSAGPQAARVKMRGVCWEGAGPVGPKHLAPLTALGVDWISQTPFGWVPSPGSPEVRFSGERGLWGETDAGIAATASYAKTLGIKTLLAPHLWVRHAAWPGDIAMASESDWAAWFDAYGRFILHYAALAQANGLEALAVGTELSATTGRESDWRALIAKVREVYHGKLTYAANWNGEPERVRFWDALDFIGVQAYYPLASKAHPSRDEIAAAMKPIAERLAALAARTGKPVVFTEVGYKSAAASLAEPWRWEADGEADLAVQRDAFTAMFSTLWDRPWFGGTFVWKWHPATDALPRDDRGFSPQGKPAQDVIKAFYTRH
jgi:Glycoside Hydrolase Family 113